MFYHCTNYDLSQLTTADRQKMHLTEDLFLLSPLNWDKYSSKNAKYFPCWGCFSTDFGPKATDLPVIIFHLTSIWGCTPAQ